MSTNNETVEVCPDCDRASMHVVAPRSGRPGNDADGKYHCSDCGHRTDELKTRERRCKGNVGMGESQMALLRADSDGLVTDGGQDIDGVPCPHPECEDNHFDTERAMKIHHTRVHGESLIKQRECEWCGELFRPISSSDANKFCSRECAGESKRRRTEKTCQECGDTFTVPDSAADSRLHCSSECGYESQRNRLTKTCYCGARFTVVESKADRNACSHACRSEAANNRPRPDDPEMLLWLLYEYEDHNLKETHRRANVVLDEEDRLTRDDVRDYLVDNGLHQSTAYAIRRQHKNGTFDAGGDSEIPDGDDSWKEYARGDD